MGAISFGGCVQAIGGLDGQHYYCRRDRARGDHGRSATAPRAELRSRARAPVTRSNRDDVFQDILSASLLGLFALTILIDLLVVERWETLSAARYTVCITTLFGFAVLVKSWAKRTIGSFGLNVLAYEMFRRGSETATILLCTTLLTMHLSTVSWEYVHPLPMFVAMLAIAAAGIVAQAVHAKLSQESTIRCVVVFGDGASGLVLAQEVKAELPEAKVCFYPTPQLVWNRSQGAAARFNSSRRPDPKLVELHPDVAVISAAGCDAQTIERLAKHLAPLPLDVLVHGSPTGAWALGQVDQFAAQPVVRLFPKPLRTRQRLIKRALDLVVSLTLLTLLLPFLLGVAVLIRLDSRGPVLFRQPRVGLNGKQFTVFKFRTMRTDETDVLAEKATTAHDPRVTRLGSLLRKTSIDELPQLFNVLLGSMSLVGPRPHAMNGTHFSTLVNHYHARHRSNQESPAWRR